MVWRGGPHCGLGRIDDSSSKHIPALASLGAKVEVNRGGAGLAFGVEQDLIEMRSRSCFHFASRKTANDNRDYLLEAFSDSLCGAFFCNTRTRCCPEGGIEAFPPITISLAVILRP